MKQNNLFNTISSASTRVCDHANYSLADTLTYFTGTDIFIYKADKTWKHIVPGKDEIWYTSTDGKIVVPNTPASIDANIVSNTYEDGWGCIKFDANVTKIENFAFGGGDFPNKPSACKLCTVIIPGAVTSIGYNAFSFIYSLKYIYIPSSVTYVSNLAFFGTTDVQTIRVDKNNTTYDSRGNCNAIVNSTTNELVRGCENTIIPDSVTKLGNDAFGCCGIKNVTISKYITNIAINTFGACMYALDTITVDPENTVYDSRDNCNAIIETATNKLRFGSNNTFVPDGIVAIGDKAMWSRYKIKDFTLPDSVTSIGIGAFSDCKNLETFTLGSGITTISNSAFGYCVKLKAIDLPQSLTNLGTTLFYACYSLTNVVLPTSLTSVPYATFYLCTGITSITTPPAATSVGEWAFSECHSLEEIDIPSGVTSIGGYAFFGDRKLKSITIRSTTPPTLGEYAFIYVPDDCVIYVPEASVEAYKAAAGWSARAEHIQAIIE